MLKPDIYMHAWNFASNAHAEQKLPGSNVPYINHIGSVTAEIIYAKLNDEKIEKFDLAVQCALLHDVIEDTNTTLQELVREFGQQIADCVLALTKNKHIVDKTDRIYDSIERIKGQRHEVSLVKLADRIVNLQVPPETWDNSKKEYYIHESRIILKELGKNSCILRKRLKSRIKTYESLYI